VPKSGGEVGEQERPKLANPNAAQRPENKQLGVQIEESKVVEKPAAKPAAKAPPEDLVARAAAAAAAARAGAKKAADIASHKTTLEQENQRLQAEEQRNRQDRMRLQKEVDDANAFKAELKKNPFGALEKGVGLTQKELVQRGLDQGSPAEKMRLLEEQLAEERNERIKLVRTLQEEKDLVQQKQAENAFFKQATDEKLYPSLQAVPPARLLKLVYQEMLDFQQVNGENSHRSKPNSFWLQTLELEYATHRKSKVTEVVSDVEETEEPIVSAPRSGTKAKPAATSRTLNQRLKTSQSSGNGKVPPNKMSRKDFIAYAAAKIEKARADHAAKKH
jgi:hypothetical protein